MNFYKKTFGFKQLYQLYKLAVSNRYTIGIAEFDNRVVEKDFEPTVRWIKDDYKEGWFADPFILRVTDKEFVLLVEEFVYKLKRGIISQLTINRDDFSIKEVRSIINTGYHLSFPAYFRRNGKVYIYPEQGARGATWLYEYDERTCKANELRVINPNDTVDTVILDMPNGKKFLTCTTAPNHNGSILDFYRFYEEGSPSDLKSEMRINSPCKTARNAGLYFKIGEKLYRPAQYCEHCYGEATEIQEISFDCDKPTLHPVNLIYSPNKDYPDAFHTFNVFENSWIAVDGRRKRFPLLAKIIG